MLKHNHIPGLATWLINDECNYSCSYCIADARDSSSRVRVQNYSQVIKKFKKHIPEGWCFYLLGGGEPTIHSDFFQIVKELVGAGYKISINTNFSSSKSDLDKFFKIVGNKCVLFLASLHLGQTDFNEFLSKIKYIREKYLAYEKLEVVSVALPKRLSELKECCKVLADNGIQFRLQPLALKDKTSYTYSPDELKIYREIISTQTHEKRKNMSAKTFGKNCYCGYKYVVINPCGEVFRCTPAMTSKSSMGNILDDSFKMYREPLVCAEKNCFCFEKYIRFFNQFINYP